LDDFIEIYSQLVKLIRLMNNFLESYHPKPFPNHNFRRLSYNSWEVEGIKLTIGNILNIYENLSSLIYTFKLLIDEKQNELANLKNKVEELESFFAPIMITQGLKGNERGGDISS